MAHPVTLPAALEGVFPACFWDQSKLWRLSTPTSSMAMKELWWHLDLPVWPSDPPHRIFDLAPVTALSHPESHPKHWRRIQGADLTRPLELVRYGGRWVMIDGYHRLARMRLDKHTGAAVRLHPQGTMDRISRAV